MGSRIKNVMFLQPRSTGGNFEYVAIFRQGMLFLSSALKEYDGRYLYDRQIWMEDRSGRIDPDRDLEGVDILCVTALINEAPRAYEVARKAKQFHPDLKIVGGGPHMGPLVLEAICAGNMDVIVKREGEDIIGPLCDVLIDYSGADLTRALHKFGGVGFIDSGAVVETPYRPTIAADYVVLPDYDSVRDLTPQNPLAAGLLETVRGCTENCSFCEVIQQFKGYRMVKRDVEWARLQQLQDLASRGLIYRSPISGDFAVFISDDLHPPPQRAVKFRDERMERTRSWRGRTDGMYMICQTRAELGSDAEMAETMRDIGMNMLYVGVESSNAKNLELVRKRQEPEQMHRDLEQLNHLGYNVVAMTIIGLPYDTEDSIMELADWVKGVSRYQTANWLTPLPATINWDGLEPVDADGGPLPEGKMRPYELYTGKQLVHKDHRWTLQESQEIYAKYMARLRPVDHLYQRIFRQMRTRAEREGVSIPVRV